MALGIDDALTAAASGIKLADTLVRTISAYRKKKGGLEVEKLIEEVRVTAVQRINDADLALVQLERTLKEKGVSLNNSLQDTIKSTPWWHAFESYRLKQIRQGFNALADAAYSAVDDIASLARCREQTEDMGHAIVESGHSKQDLSAQLLKASSVGEAIAILRNELARQKKALQ
jgi:hypothetical protein